MTPEANEVYSVRNTHREKEPTTIMYDREKEETTKVDRTSRGVRAVPRAAHTHEQHTKEVQRGQTRRKETSIFITHTSSRISFSKGFQQKKEKGERGDDRHE